MKRPALLLLAVVTLATALGAAVWRESARPTPVVLVPSLTGQPELCLTCHAGIEEISASHPRDAFGCVICHGGNGMALDKARAHDGLRGRRNPSDLSVAAESCGQENCHGGYADPERNHVARVQNSMQATYAGAFATLRYSFGLQSSPVAQVGVAAARDPSADRPANGMPSLAAFVPGAAAIEQKFQQQCLNGGCHLSAAARSDSYYTRGTGCAACHALTAEDGRYRGGDPAITRTDAGHAAQHRLTTNIPYSQCDHCHNRGNYSLKQMAFIARDDLPPVAAPLPATMPPEGRRQREYYQPGTVFTRCEIELDCIDCHTAQEAMGDGHIYGSKKDAQVIQCQTCHGTRDRLPATAAIQSADEAAMRQARLSGHADFLKIGDRVAVTARGERLWSVKQTGAAQFTQVSKAAGSAWSVPPVKGSACTQDGSSQSSEYCHTCHKAES